MLMFSEERNLLVTEREEEMELKDKNKTRSKSSSQLFEGERSGE